MSSDPTITPPPVDMPPNLPVERPRVRFSGARWFFTGIIRVTYRVWTRIAAHLFPEDSRAERIVRSLHIPLPDQLNMSWVTGKLAVGGRIRPEDIAAVARVGVTHVIDTRSEHSDDAQALAKEHIQLLYLPTRDTFPLTVEQMMEGSKWAQQVMEQGGRVLIHCEHGVGRSVLLTCAVLVYEGMHAQDAQQLVQQKRWQAAPNHKQVARLREFEARVDASRHASNAPSPSA
ncbi:MAG TPA: dual specificity protein phosphatase [Ktedonobacteraceae bacterium]|nr:dual specificity protein phosphatase [Ktedonobacteraceae bacterium]